jgi:hypothetical protein
MEYVGGDEDPEPPEDPSEDPEADPEPDPELEAATAVHGIRIS